MASTNGLSKVQHAEGSRCLVISCGNRPSGGGLSFVFAGVFARTSLATRYRLPCNYRESELKSKLSPSNDFTRLPLSCLPSV